MWRNTNWHDHSVANGENTLLRLKSSIVMPSRPSEPAKSIPLSTCPVFANERIVLQHLHVDKIDDVKIAR